MHEHSTFLTNRIQLFFHLLSVLVYWFFGMAVTFFLRHKIMHCLCKGPLHCPDVHYGIHINVTLLSAPPYLPENSIITLISRLFHLCFMLVKSVSYAFVPCIHHKLLCIIYAYIHLVKYSCTGFLCSLLTEIIHPNESMGTPERAYNIKIT